MVFSSPRFIVFLLVVLAVLWRLKERERQKVFLAGASCLFYAAWDYRYLALLLFVSGVDWGCGALIARTASTSVRRAWLSLSVISNLGILAYFKYYGFLVSNLRVLGLDLPLRDVLLPAGISFYTFKSMSYTIDVYRGHIQPTRRWRDYATFITFFPELIAGPIVRASAFLPQLQKPIGPTLERLRVGGGLFLLGLTKKNLLADHLATVADPVFADPAMYSTETVWAGVLAYSFQIYCDFSGYSDMAIGTAKMIGYDLPENFNMPYLAANVAEFWRRWHMTLSAWLRDYLYIPLGGNRAGSGRSIANLFITMALGGLWHGASWNFVLWGALHGTALAAHRVWKARGLRLARVQGVVLTFAFVTLCWIPFRASSLEIAGVMLGHMAGFGPAGASWYPEVLAWAIPALAIGHAIGAFVARLPIPGDADWEAPLWPALDISVSRAPLAGRCLRFGVGTMPGAFIVTFWILGLFYFASVRVSPFIYFQF